MYEGVGEGGGRGVEKVPSFLCSNLVTSNDCRSASFSYMAVYTCTRFHMSLVLFCEKKNPVADIKDDDEVVVYHRNLWKQANSSSAQTKNTTPS